MNGDGSLVEGAFQNLPGRPVVRGTVVEHCQADTLAIGHQFLVGSLVEDRNNVAIFINTKAVDGVLGLSPDGEGSRYIFPA